MTDYVLRTHNLCKKFGGIVATDHVNLNIERGQIHAIIGPNGAGKTTLLSQLCGQLLPDTGTIEFNGRDITHTSTPQRALMGIARSYQITSVILPMTLLQNVMLAVQATTGHSYRFWSPVMKDRSLVDMAMENLSQLGLDDRANHLASNVSHGEQRQLEVVMALAMKPKLLLLDEPMAGMGREESKDMIDILLKLKNHQTMLLVEHDMDAVFRLADRLSVLVNGHIIATDTVSGIKSNLSVQQAYLGENHA